MQGDYASERNSGKNRFVVTRDVGWGGWMKVVRRYKFQL